MTINRSKSAQIIRDSTDCYNNFMVELKYKIIAEAVDKAMPSLTSSCAPFEK